MTCTEFDATINQFQAAVSQLVAKDPWWKRKAWETMQSTLDAAQAAAAAELVRRGVLAAEPAPEAPQAIP